MRYSRASARAQKPGLVDASVKTELAQGRRVVGQGREQERRRALAAPQCRQALIPRSVRSRTAAEGSVTPRRRICMTCSRGLATSTRAGRARSASIASNRWAGRAAARNEG